MKVIEESATLNLSQDIDDLLASFSSQQSTGVMQSKETCKVSRFRIKWHIDILIDGQSTYRGIANDISTQGVSIYLNRNLSATRCVLHLHVPPHDLAKKSHIIAVSGKVIYTVYDSSKQSFRAAVSFLNFNLESDLAYLGERLVKHHLKLPEFER